MRALERINLIEDVAKELQSRMSYDDIKSYLKAYKVDTDKPTSNVNSKRIYVKELLASESDAVIIDIASELELTPSNQAVNHLTSDPSFWMPFHFKLFLSHISSFKKNTSLLQHTLKNYGITAFVAHVDIEPTKQWQDEILLGLSTMDALAAVLMPGFKESNWTDQEVGFAVSKGVLIIPIIRGLNPYGFIEKYQGIQAEGKSVSDVAGSIFKTLTSSLKTKEKMISCLVDSTLQSLTTNEAAQKLEHLDSVKDIPIHHLERLRDGATVSTVLSKGLANSALNKILSKRNIKINVTGTKWDDFDDDIAF